MPSTVHCKAALLVGAELNRIFWGVCRLNLMKSAFSGLQRRHNRKLVIPPGICPLNLEKSFVTDDLSGTHA